MNTVTSGTEKFRRMMASLACVIVGGASFALSYVALSEVAVREQAVPGALGWLVPIVVDGGVICGSAIIWSQSKSTSARPVFPFMFVGTLVVISVIVNASHAGPSILAKGIASLPPLVLLGTLELVASQGRRDRLQASKAAVAPLTPTSAPIATQAPVEHRQSTASVASSQPVVRDLPVQTASATYVATEDGRVPSPINNGLDLDTVDDSQGWTTPSSLDVELNQITGASRRNNPNRRAVRVRAEGPTQ